MLGGGGNQLELCSTDRASASSQRARASPVTSGPPTWAGRPAAHMVTKDLEQCGRHVMRRVTSSTTYRRPALYMPAYLPTLTPTHLLTHSSTSSPTHLPFYAPTYSQIHLPIHPHIHPLTYRPTHSYTHSPTHLLSDPPSLLMKWFFFSELFGK